MIFIPDQTIDRQLQLKPSAHFRLLLRGSLPAKASGHIGFLDNAVGIRALRAWSMTLPEL